MRGSSLMAFLNQFFLTWQTKYWYLNVYSALWRVKTEKDKAHGYEGEVGYLANSCKIRHFEQNKAV